jgi:hypothetical protein
MSKRLIAFSAALLLIASACKHTRNVTKTEPVAPTTSSIDALSESLAKNMVDYKWLRMKTSVTYEDQDNSYPTAAAQIKMHKDELIWGSVSVLIEIVRSQINKDSATMLLRTSKQYRTFPVNDLQQMLAIEGLDLSALQRLILAYPPFGLNKDSKITKTGDLYQLERTTPTFKEQMDISGKNMRLSKYRYERNYNEYMEVSYPEFMNVEGRTMPKTVVITVARPEKMKITIDVSDYTFLDTDEAPFSIPSSYSRAQ